MALKGQVKADYQRDSQMTSAALVHYDAMRRELDACHSVDEVKTFRNKALALETYARVANDHEAERKLAEIRIRAERSAGAMLRDGEKAKASGSNQHSKVEPSANPRAPKPLSELKISKQQSSDWQKLADVPGQAPGTLRLRSD